VFDARPPPEREGRQVQSADGLVATDAVGSEAAGAWKAVVVAPAESRPQARHLVKWLAARRSVGVPRETRYQCCRPLMNQ